MATLMHSPTSPSPSKQPLSVSYSDFQPTLTPRATGGVARIFHNFLLLLLLAIAVVGIYQTTWNADDYATSVFNGGLMVLVSGLALTGLRVLLASRGLLQDEDDRFLNVGLGVALIGVILIVGSLFVVLFTI